MDELFIIRNRLKELGINDPLIISLLEQIEKRLTLAEKIESSLYDTEQYIVYMHTDPLGRVYIGITKNTPQNRWSEGVGYESNKRFTNAIRRFGWLNINHKIVDAGLTKEEAEKIENSLIIQYKSYKKEFGYNIRVDLEEKETNSLQTDVPDSNSTSKKEEMLVLDESKQAEIKTHNAYDIAVECIKQFNLYCISDTIYYYDGKNYCSDKDNPFIKKYLLENYNVTTRKLSEIIKQICILSEAQKSVFDDDTQVQLGLKKQSKSSSVELWISEQCISVEDLLKTPTKTIYEEYIEWCNKKGEVKLGKKSFNRIIVNLFSFESKPRQRSDGKRYFIK